MIKFLGLHHPFFRPLLRRVLTMLAIAIWGIVEITAGNFGWAVFAAVLCAICGAAFFIITDPKAHGDNDG